MRRRFLLHLFLIIGVTLHGRAIYCETAPLEVGLFYIPYYLESEHEGVFNKILLEAARVNKVYLKKKIYPAKRLLKKFEEREISGFLPSVSDFRGEGVVETIPFYYKKDYFFYHRLNRPDFAAENSTKKISVCLTRGYPYDQKTLADSRYSFTYAESDSGCFKMLDARRVDALICELVTGIFSLEREGSSEIRIHPIEISSSPVSIAFRNDKDGVHYVKIFSQALESLIRSGVLENSYFSQAKKIAAKYGVDFHPLKK